MSRELYNFKSFETLAAASEALACDVAEALRKAIATHGQAVMAVPGGTTPGSFLRALAREPVTWGAVTVLLTDERCVPSDDPRSNERLVRETFAPVTDSIAHFQPLYAADEVGMKAITNALATLPPLDVLVSGMGADAHIASLFPGSPTVLDVAGGDFVPAQPDGLEPRISLSRKRLTHASFTALLISGEAKKIILAEAAQKRDALTHPVSMLLGLNPPVSVYWATR